jgi:hypothetical protein
VWTFPLFELFNCNISDWKNGGGNKLRASKKDLKKKNETNGPSQKYEHVEKMEVMQDEKGMNSERARGNLCPDLFCYDG